MNMQPLHRFIDSVRGAYDYVFGRILQRQRTRISLFLLGTLLTLAAGLAPSPPQASKLAIPPRGFDHNGRADLAIGTPRENVGTTTDAGAVNVLYGSSPWLSTAGNQYWNQAESGVLDTAEASDRFGEALAFGNFDCDLYLDLAIGIPQEDVGTVVDAGGVQILYGSRSGLSSARNQFWTQDSPGVGGGAEAGDGFGSALAAGDFNGDGCDDLAIGVPFEDTGTTTNNGAVNVLYGAPSGLIAGTQTLYQGFESLVGTPVDEDRFGHALATGDFNKDGKDDLAVGIPLKDHGATNNGGVVIVYGSSLGLRGVGSTLWSQATANVEGVPDDSDEFGYALATGDFDGDGYDDLAIGVPFEDEGATDAGAVNMLYGSAAGISAAGDQIRNQNSPGIPGDAALGDHFGWALAAGDFNRDGNDDLAIGIPKKDDGATDNGGVVILSGSSVGIGSTGHQFWSQSSSNVEGVPENGDEFGTAVAAGDFDGDGYDDLAIGVPLEDQGTTADAGAINILYGSAMGLSAAGDQIFSQDSPGMSGTTAEAGDRFGSSLAAPRAQPVVYLPMIRR